jgi:hypothetical protein
MDKKKSFWTLGELMGILIGELADQGGFINMVRYIPGTGLYSVSGNDTCNQINNSILEDFAPKDGFDSKYEFEEIAKWWNEKNLYYIGLLSTIGFREPQVLKNLSTTFRGSKKTKAPGPTTDKAKMNSLRESYITEAAKILKKNPHLTGPALLKYSSLKTLIRDSGLPEEGYPQDSNILKHWMLDVRKRAAIQNKYGPKAK